MTKRLLFVCLGLLALATASHLVADYGQASYVDHSTTGIVAANAQCVLLDDGQVWFYALDGWTRMWAESPPMPVSQIRFWDNGYLVTTDGALWERWGGWHSCGAPPRNQ